MTDEKSSARREDGLPSRVSPIAGVNVSRDRLPMRWTTSPALANPEWQPAVGAVMGELIERYGGKPGNYTPGEVLDGYEAFTDVTGTRQTLGNAAIYTWRADETRVLDRQDPNGLQAVIIEHPEHPDLLIFQVSHGGDLYDAGFYHAPTQRFALSKNTGKELPS